jgi:DNA-binding MarR family transcriptional regulator
MSARTIYLIKRVETEVTARMTQLLGAYDITPTQFIILSFVGDNEADLSSAQLSRRFLMTPQSMNEVVTILQRKGLLEKKSDPNHKRILHLQLTEKGQETLTHCNKAMDNLEVQLFDNMGAQDLTLYRQMMGKVLDNTKVL